MKRAAIIGATGFGGLGLLEILLRHPGIRPTQLVARKETGVKIAEIFPHLAPFYDLTVTELGDLDMDTVDIAFFSTPDQAGMGLIHDFAAKNIPVIDFSGDFRFGTIDEYTVYAKNKSMEPVHTAQDMLPRSVYGLCEKNRERIRTASVVGNPGCFAMSLMLGSLPLAEHGIIREGSMVADSKSGVSGAGKSPGAANFYPQRYENINTYREGRHQHLVEVENALNRFGREYRVFFIPQVVPMTRGILTNIYADPSGKTSTAELLELFRSYYADEPFVRVTDKSPNLTDVRGSNFCLIRPLYDERTGKILVTSVIDNLMKGQSGNAVQVANIMLGFDETTGLLIPGSYP